MVDNYVRSLHPNQFLALIEHIRNLAFTKDIRKSANRLEVKATGRKSKRKPNSASEESQSGQSSRTREQAQGQFPQVESPTVDEEFINYIRFLQEMEIYCALKYATQHGDIGLIIRIIPRLCIYFHGGPAKNYAREMLYLFRLVSTDACTPALRRAILRNGLVNKRGKPDSWMPIDLLVELLNLELKLIIYARRNGTFGADELFKDCILLCDYASSLRKAFEIHLSSPTSGEHTPKDFKKDIRYLADLILAEGSISPTRPRSCPHKSLNHIGRGVNALYSGAISKFNQQLSDLSRFDIHHADRSDHNNPGGDTHEPIREDASGDVEAVEAMEAHNDNENDAARDQESDTASSSEEDDSDCDIPRVEAHLYSLLVRFPSDLLNVLNINFIFTAN
jgi:hypothetical protein